MASHFDAPSFHPLTSTSFLDFVVSDAQCTASLGGALSIGATASDSGKKRKVVKIVSQLRHTERSDKVDYCTLLQDTHVQHHFISSPFYFHPCVCVCVGRGEV